MQFIRNQSRAVMVIWALLALAFAEALLFGRWSLAFISLATFGLSLVPQLLASRLSLTLPLPFLLGTTLFIVASVFLGEAFDFYGRYWWWDIALHAASSVGFGLTGFLFVFMLFEGDRFAAPPAALAFISFCVAMTIGGLWEIFEFAMDQWFGLNMQKSGLPDTMGDLIVNAIGGGVASLSGYAYLRRSRPGLLGHLIAQFVRANRRFYQKSRDRLKR